MADPRLPASIASLPKAELHLHLEGSMEPATVCALAKRAGTAISEAEVRARYAFGDFGGFIETFKWVTSFLRAPEDYALITTALCESLLQQNVVYAEVTLSVGVMLLRLQDVEANFSAIRRAAGSYARKGLRLQWIFDAVRQLGAGPAMQVAHIAAKCRSEGVVAFGIGGDELSVPAGDFRASYDYTAEHGLHRLMHAGEIGGPAQIRDAVELLGVERIGHGIAAIHDPALLELLTARRIPLEVCPASNLRTGALARQLGRADARIEEHPLPQLIRSGVPVVLSTDDPAIFQCSLGGEYAAAAAMGLNESELTGLVRMSFQQAFLPEAERRAGARVML